MSLFHTHALSFRKAFVGYVLKNEMHMSKEEVRIVGRKGGRGFSGISENQPR